MAGTEQVVAGLVLIGSGLLLIVLVRKPIVGVPQTRITGFRTPARAVSDDAIRAGHRVSAALLNAGSLLLVMAVAGILLLEPGALSVTVAVLGTCGATGFMFVGAVRGERESRRVDRASDEAVS
ncbi:hypothetical protein GIY23_22430 [Allosaccharopolyspora coralli]|uniref:SdpI family protein n=1 Tax=Allosaccharopolyspora coralli TaxID=2665642 RepID=A0A5Q3QDA5_9PSEU|nr:hypothetical protein [Allosaccharopolyspora coralli]QGK71890.1 hypothetical protein GIY23_22430 [Allosaccharopolyspora coralli]